MSGPGGPIQGKVRNSLISFNKQMNITALKKVSEKSIVKKFVKCRKIQFVFYSAFILYALKNTPYTTEKQINIFLSYKGWGL